SFDQVSHAVNSDSQVPYPIPVYRGCRWATAMLLLSRCRLQVVGCLRPPIRGGKLPGESFWARYRANQLRYVHACDDRGADDVTCYEKRLTKWQLHEIRMGRFPANIEEDTIKFTSSWEQCSDLI